jgi:hypothetical protein
MTNIETDFEKYDFTFDKTTQFYQRLPYEEGEVLIAPNDSVKASLINKKLFYLHYNFLFLYKLCNYADFFIPKTTIFKFKGTNEVLFEENFRKFIFTDDTGIVESRKAAVSYNNPIIGGTTLFYATEKELCAMTVDRSSLKLLTRTQYVDPLSGSITFSNITQVKTNEKGELYVVDNDYKNIYYYDINTVLRGDGIYRQLPYLKNVIGGAGKIYENTKFNNIRNICVNTNYVVVEDDINSCIKILNKDLNWLNTIPFKAFFEENGNFDCLAIDSFNKVYGIIGRRLFTYQIDEKYNLAQLAEYDISSYIKLNDHVKEISFTQQDPLIFYIFTNRSIIKVWSSDPSGCIGEFPLDEELVWGTVFFAANNEDTLMIKTKSSENEREVKFIGYNDDLNISSLLVKKSFDIFDYDNIKIQENEYTAAWVYQKSIKKILFNLNTLVQQIKFRLVEDNRTISVIIDRIYNQIFLNYATPSESSFNTNIGQNELFQAEVVNRIISEIIIFQRTLLLYVLNNKTTKVYYSPAPQKRLSNVITYTYYADDSISIFPNPMKLQPLEELVPLGGIMLSLGGAPYRSGEGVSVVDGIFN